LQRFRVADEQWPWIRFEQLSIPSFRELETFVSVDQLGGCRLDGARHEATLVVGVVVRLAHGSDEAPQIGRDGLGARTAEVPPELSRQNRMQRVERCRRTRRGHRTARAVMVIV
jgi:hypothetical protein